MHLREIHGPDAQLGVGAARQMILDPRRRKAFEQIEDLQGTPVQVGTALDMEHPHGAASACISTASASITSSTPISRMQVKAPSQVGRRLQGEQARGW
jgi:hypothetical protein